jgi:NADPH:quinone reductase-like Zn-dependent oxidoreductase
MKAIYLQQYGNAEQLIIGQLDKPVIHSKQVLIKVAATSVNPVDWMIREGFLKESGMHTLPLVLGWDVAGKIVAKGEHVDDFSIGDAVYAHTPISKQGAYAEFIAVDSHIIAAQPKTLTAQRAAAVPLAATTAWQALTQGCQIKAGDKVLIHNASGGVGSFAVQIAKALGAYVIGTASTKNADFVKRLGADEFIDYRTQKFEEIVSKVDSVFAAVGGNNILERSVKVLKNGGHLISLLDELDEPTAQAIKDEHNISYQRWWVTPNAADLTSITTLIDKGDIEVKIDTVFPYTEVKQAHALSESQRAIGKIILHFSD